MNHQDAFDDLTALRAQAQQLLNSEERIQKANEAVDKAKIAYANACLREDLGQVRLEACGVITYLSDAMMLYHGQYFKHGVKRTFEELSALPIDGVFVRLIQEAVVCKDVGQMRDLLKQLILYAEGHIQNDKPKEKPSESLSGTYEEMCSNWRNKIEEAAKNADAFASFMGLCSFQFMLSDIAEEVEIGAFPVMENYDPEHLDNNVTVFDKYLQKYEQVYQQAGINVKRYADVDEFVADCLDR